MEKDPDQDKIWIKNFYLKIIEEYSE